MRNDKEFVQPLSIGFSIDGCDLVVTPIVVGEVFALLELIEPVFEDLAQLDYDALASTPPELLALPADPAWQARRQLAQADLGRLLVKAHQPLLAAMALCTRAHTAADGTRVDGAAHAAWLRGLLLDRAAEILLVCVEVNRDFFSRAMPGLLALASRLTAKVPVAAAASAGATPSSP